MHGGGLVLGTYAATTPFDLWCQKYGCVGVSVEYRLAPETRPYPGPLEDCYRGLLGARPRRRAGRRSAAHRHRWGQRRRRSGRRSHALLARDRGEVHYSSAADLPDARRSPDHPVEHLEGPDLAAGGQPYGWTAYLGATKGGPDVPAYAAPARATDLTGLPPTLISVGAIDGFSDEDMDYATRLRQAGVPVELHVYPGMPHGFDSLLPNLPLSQRAVRDMEEWLADRLA
ncbi:MAG: alpha/beta hydrolase fold domain-containing protein [Acidimicrobiales bacterium]